MAKKKTAPRPPGESIRFSPQAAIDRFTIDAVSAGRKRYEDDPGFLIGLHQEVLSLTDADGKIRMAVKSGAGLGSDRLVLVCDGEECVVFMRDLLRAWVKTVKPKMAKYIPDSPLTRPKPRPKTTKKKGAKKA